MDNDLPEPLTPPHCDLRGLEWLPLFGRRMLGSRFFSLARRNPRAGLAGVALWIAAWDQRPAASVPSDDFDLAGLAGFGEDLNSWHAVKSTALHGFVLCNDGRLYHRFLAEEAVKAFDLRLRSDKRRVADRERLRAWREAQKKTGEAPYTEKRPVETPHETRVETDINGCEETADETRFVAADKTRHDTTVQRKKESSPELPATPMRKRSRTANSDWRQDDGFVRFYNGYPRRVAPAEAHKAWVAAMRKGAAPAEIVAGIRAYAFAEDARFIPHPATWFRGESWIIDKSAPAPASREPPSQVCMTTASGHVLTNDELFEVAT